MKKKSMCLFGCCVLVVCLFGFCSCAKEYRKSVPATRPEYIYPIIEFEKHNYDIPSEVNILPNHKQVFWFRPEIQADYLFTTTADCELNIYEDYDAYTRTGTNNVPTIEGKVHLMNEEVYYIELENKTENVAIGVVRSVIVAPEIKV